MAVIACRQCGAELSGQGGKYRAASMSGSIMGDEYIESYYLCEACGVYTVEIYHDRFLGEESVSLSGPLSRAEGDAKVKLIRQCSEPWNKRCRCPAHLSYFGESLD